MGVVGHEQRAVITGAPPQRIPAYLQFNVEDRQLCIALMQAYVGPAAVFGSAEMLIIDEGRLYKKRKYAPDSGLRLKLDHGVVAFAVLHALIVKNGERAFQIAVGSGKSFHGFDKQVVDVFGGSRLGYFRIKKFSVSRLNIPARCGRRFLSITFIQRLNKLPADFTSGKGFDGIQLASDKAFRRPEFHVAVKIAFQGNVYRCGRMGRRRKMQDEEQHGEE